METNFRVISGSVTDRGLSDKRPQNEDSYADLPQLGLFAVADGVGGANAGEVASQMAIEILSEAFASLRAGGDAEEMMRAAIQQANTAIFQMSSDIPQLSTMATTVVALHISGNIATIGHVGDSRLYRVDEKGNLYRETRDHSVVEEEVRAGRLTPEQAENHPSRNVISRALGAEAAVEVDLKTIMFAQGTSFLLCSDGITRHITDLEISQLLMSPLEPDEICQTMKSLCYERGAEDNLTAVVIRCGARSSGLGFRQDEIEEATIATPRASEEMPVAVPVAREELPMFEEAPPQTIDIGLSSLSGQLSYSIEEQDKQLAEAGVDTEWAGDAAELPAAPPTSSSGVVHSKRSVDDLDLLVYQGGGDGGSRSGGGSILKSLLLLLLGVAIGAGAFYGAQKYLPKAPEIQPLTEVQTPNIAYSAFEDARRTVDANPEQFIKNLEGKANGAEDNYLLARAYLHKNKLTEAVNCLIAAKNQLKDVPADQQKMLATEIAILGAVAADPKAAQAFQTSAASMMAPKAVEGNTNTNVNANVPSNAKPAGNVNAGKKPGNVK